jgi:hypothetical protein
MPDHKNMPDTVRAPRANRMSPSAVEVKAACSPERPSADQISVEGARRRRRRVQLVCPSWSAITAARAPPPSAAAIPSPVATPAGCQPQMNAVAATAATTAILVAMRVHRITSSPLSVATVVTFSMAARTPTMPAERALTAGRTPRPPTAAPPGWLAPRSGPARPLGRHRRPPPRRHRGPPPGRTLVHLEDRAVHRRHDRQAPPRHHRRQI